MPWAIGGGGGGRTTATAPAPSQKRTRRTPHRLRRARGQRSEGGRGSRDEGVRVGPEDRVCTPEAEGEREDPPLLRVLSCGGPSQRSIRGEGGGGLGRDA